MLLEKSTVTSVTKQSTSVIEAKELRANQQRSHRDKNAPSPTAVEYKLGFIISLNTRPICVLLSS